ncbi:hypothetical protein B0O99DRAFT_526964 [Bisporella sp. PMI_857]|nr:hypothetical protein B0O99DRAFT_526964 [Bisporella sp. PMI_857]
MSATVSKYALQAAKLAKLSEVQVGLGILLVLGALPRLNRWLSRRAVNNYATDKTWNFKKEIVIVTGGSSGIGACMVTKLQERKVYKIIILDMIAPKGKLANNTYFYQIDLSSGAEIIDITKKIHADHGDPTVLINNAGIGHAKEIMSLDEARLQKIFAVNIISHFLLARELLPSMIRHNHGHIVTIASMASFGTQATNVDYACTKVGALAFHEGLAQELRLIYNAPLVRTTVVHPTWVRTPMIAEVLEKGKLRDDSIAPEVVADAVVDQIFSGYGAQIVLPSSLAKMSLIRGLPLWVQEYFRNGLSKAILALPQAS